jgi:hypothetical protein
MLNDAANSSCELTTDRDRDAKAIAAIVAPPAYCPGCLAAEGTSWPDGATSRHCAGCLATMRRVYRCKRWNADPAHQAMAGHASFDAFSARWRASSGLAPLSAEAVRKYVTPDMIRGVLGLFLPAYFQQAIYRAWCAGQLLPVVAWLSDDPPQEPKGLCAQSANRTERGVEGGAADA